MSLLAAICADGTALPPDIIFVLKNSTIQSHWVADIEARTHLIHVASSSRGWTDKDIGLAWLEQVFDRYNKPKARLKYRLLIVDGHGSHLTQAFIEYCHQKRIILAVLPPHSTQTLQPLDVVVEVVLEARLGVRFGWVSGMSEASGTVDYLRGSVIVKVIVV